MSFNKINSFIKNVNKLDEILLAVTVLIMFIILLAQVSSRFIFRIPLPSSQELLIFFMLVSVYLGAGIAARDNKHIALEFFVNALPKKMGRVAYLIADLVSLVFLGIIVYQAIQLMSQTQGTTVESSPIPVPVYYLAVAIGCLLMIINYLSHFVAKIWSAKSGEEN